MYRQLLFITAVIAVGVLACPAGASLIVEYDIANALGGTADVAELAEGVIASQLTITGAEPLNPSWGYLGAMCAKGWDSDWDAKKYYEWSISALTDQEIAYETVSLALARGKFKNHTGAELWELRSSADGYEAVLAQFDISKSKYDEQTIFENVDISALGTQGGTVTFRLYGYGDKGGTDYAGLANYDASSKSSDALSGKGINVQMTGELVPEPATLGCLAAGGWMLFRRRKA